MSVKTWLKGIGTELLGDRGGGGKGMLADGEVEGGQATVLAEVMLTQQRAPRGNPEITSIFKRTNSKRPSHRPPGPRARPGVCFELSWRAGQGSSRGCIALEAVSLRPCRLCLFWPFLLVNLHLVFIPHSLGSSQECINHSVSKQTAGPPKGWKIKPPEWG